MKPLFHLAAIALCTSICQVSADDQSPDINYNPAGSSLDWNGVNGKTYFIEWSTDLSDWSYFPVIRSGNGSLLSHGFSSSASKFFLRLKSTDQPDGGDPESADFDNDNISNLDEIKVGGSQTDPFLFSTADNGISDYFSDFDGNTLADGWELKYNDQIGLFTANGDTDDDGLSESQEYTEDTDPTNRDTDDDGLTDGEEVNQTTDPLVNQFLLNQEVPNLIDSGSNINLPNSLYAVFTMDNNTPIAHPDNIDYFRLNNELGNSSRYMETFLFDNNANITFEQGVIGERLGMSLEEDVACFINAPNISVNATFSFWLKLPERTSAEQNSPILSYRNDEWGTYTILTYNKAATSSGSDQFELYQRRVTAFSVIDDEDFVDLDTLHPTLDRLDDDQWHHMSLVFTQGDLRIYIDGNGGARLTAPFEDLHHLLEDLLSNQIVFSYDYGKPSTATTLRASFDQMVVHNRALNYFERVALATYDTDGDGVTDKMETEGGSDPFYYSLDIDNDGLTNEEELAGVATFPNGNTVNFGETNVFTSDSDGDLFDDYWEAQYFSSSIDPNDVNKPNPTADPDNDGHTNYQELINGTNPNEFDSDNDNIGDGAEVDFGSDPNNITSIPLEPSDFYGNENLGSYFPIGAIDVTLDAGNGEGSNTIIANVGDDSSSNSERWRLIIGDKQLVAPTFGELSGRTPFALDPSENHRITLQHVGTDPSLDLEEPDYDYTAIVETPDGSPFLLCDPDGLLTSGANDIDIGEVSQKEAYLIPLDGYSFSESYSGGDAVGPRYRKVALNGRPKPDEKPEQEEESDLPDEQTYIDAFRLSLHHDNSLNYMPLAASDLVLQANMSSTETGFSDRYGLKPKERFDLPFGVGWSSNLCSYVEVVETIGNEVAVDPITVNVVDEAGRQQRFGTVDFNQFFPWPSARVDKKTYLNELNRFGDTFVMQKKFGNTLTYTKCDTWFMYSTDRIDGSTKVKRHTYWRLTQVEDRYGVRLDYDYSEPGTPNNVSLIPRTISSPDRPNQFLVIERTSDFRRVASITDSRGNVTSFDYDTTTSLNYDGVSVVVPRLEEITYADNTVANYTYSGGRETETDNSNPSEPVVTQHFHTNIGSISDKKGNTHTFTYGFDQSSEYWSANASGTRTATDISGLPDDIQECVEDALEQQGTSGNGSWKRIYGQSRRIASVVLPNNIGTSSFTRTGSTRYGEVVDFIAPPVTTVTDAVGNQTIYEFLDLEAEIVDVDTTPESISKEWMIYYLTSKIHHGAIAGGSGHLGVETYTFDKASGLSLKTATDISGNTTTWEYEDTRTQPTGINANSITMSKWADPAAKIDALTRRESYTYGAFRMMEDIDNVYGTLTEYTIDALGRRKAKDVLENGTTLLQQENYLYGNTSFEAFQTGMEKVAYSNPSNQTWEVDLTSEYTPDTRGRLWKEAIDPDGLNLLTQHSYDLNNNRTLTTDARGNTTLFEYDKLNRLVEITYPVAGTSTGGQSGY